MSDEAKEPKVGDMVAFQDDEGDWGEALITEVPDDSFNEETGLFEVETEDGPFTVYWSEDELAWVHSEE